METQMESVFWLIQVMLLYYYSKMCIQIKLTRQPPCYKDLYVHYFKFIKFKVKLKGMKLCLQVESFQQRL